MIRGGAAAGPKPGDGGEHGRNDQEQDAERDEYFVYAHGRSIAAGWARKDRADAGTGPVAQPRPLVQNACRGKKGKSVGEGTVKKRKDGR